MKLNNIILGGAFSLALMMTTACGLDYSPLDTYSDKTEGITEEQEEIVFLNRADVESYMKRLYDKITNRQEHWYLDMLLIAESHSDNAYAGTTGAEVQPFEDNSIEGSNSVIARDWDRFMTDAADATKFIVNVDKVQDGSLTQAEVEEYRAQAQIFRALIWFDMVRLWGNIPIITVPAGNITADNIEESYQAYFPSQNTELEAYQQIEADLLEAVKYAPDNNGDKTRFSKSVARALLAKVYAEKPLRDYNKVIQYAEQLEAEGFTLVPDYATLFAVDGPVKDGFTATPLAENTVESILEGHYAIGSGNWASWMFGRCLEDWDNSFTWAKWVTPSRDLVSAYDAVGDTQRKEQSIVWYSCTWSNYYPADNYAFMYKCRSGYSVLWKLRYADILLLKAEAYLMGENQNLAAAAEIIDRVRARAGVKPLTSSEKSSHENLFNAYLNERRLELAMEGQRWYDLCRLDMVEKIMNAVYAKDPGRHALKTPFTANSYLMPIPQGVIDNNDNIVQNPGY
ncbi:MAG: RagB/SusD family nutrient uptake outer membrane protein [Bacteroides sp.]|nr:RagB/SusD family nutrient uptake outer membrane protein [Bacteroides sp.]